MKTLLLTTSLLCIFCVSANGQTTETFDLVTYTPPDGWTKDSTKEGVVTFSTEDKKGAFCLIHVFRSRESAGTIDADFQREWSDLAANPLGIKKSPEMASNSREGGWSELSGAVIYAGENGNTLAVLTVLSSNGRVLSILSVFNDDAYTSVVEDFINNLKLTRPASAETGSNTSVVLTGGGNSSGISISTTNFDDGWTASPQADYVLVTKGATKVYLFYGVTMNENMRPPAIEVRDFFWQTLVAPRFKVVTANAWKESYSTIEHIEGKAMDRQTGTSVWVAMNVVRENGVAKTVVASAPDKETYYRQFPHPDNLANMLVYNKFAVSKQDIVGNWQGGSSSAMNYYEVYTGNYAGMNFSSMSDDFTFDSKGTYQSQHKGATGMAGTAKFYQQKYDGRYTVSTWEISATNRYGGKSAAFDAYFEAVKGGRVLHLTDKQYSGIRYHLVKAK